MVISGLYNGYDFFFNGVDNHADGTVTIQEGWHIPFVRNRLNNPVGRLLGADGMPVRQIRRDTGADVIVHTNDIRFLRKPAKVTLRIRGRPLEARHRFQWAKDWVLAITHPTDPLAIAMGDFQLYHKDVDPATVYWHPAAFQGVYVGPNPANNMEAVADLDPVIGQN